MRTRRTTKLEASEETSTLQNEELKIRTLEEDDVIPKGNAETESNDDDDVTTTPLPDVIKLQSSTRESDHVITLASTLDPGPGPELYFSCDTDTMIDALMVPAGTRGRVEGRGYPNDGNEIMKKSVITSDFEQKESCLPSSQSRYAIRRNNKAIRDKSSGKMWFDMSAPHLTPQLKNDLHLLRMRNALDPSRHYKANDSKKLPQYFQVGRILSSSADFYSSRVPRRQQKQSLVDELLSDDEFRSYHKKKYLELQNKFMSGTKRRKSITFKKKFKNKK